MFTRTKLLGKVIADRVQDFMVWDKMPKKILKKHPTAYVICPDFRVALPKNKFLTPAQEGVTYKLRVGIVGANRHRIRSMLDHMIMCGKKDVIAGKFAFWLHAVNYSTPTKHLGGYRIDLTYIFMLRQLKLIEIKENKTEENHD